MTTEKFNPYENLERAASGIPEEQMLTVPGLEDQILFACYDSGALLDFDEHKKEYLAQLTEDWPLIEAYCKKYDAYLVEVSLSEENGNLGCGPGGKWDLSYTFDDGTLHYLREGLEKSV